MRAPGLTLLLLLVAASPAMAQAATPAADGVIDHLHGNLYRVRVGPQQTIFVVTADGIVLADPISRANALWLHEEFETRFPSQPVRYVVLTQHQFDRAEGATVFSATAQIVGHERFNDALTDARHAFRGRLARLDRNLDRALQPNELAASPDAARLLSRDWNEDGTITPEELYRQVYSVTTKFDERLTITLGGQAIELIHAPAPGMPDLAMAYIPGERLLFTSGQVPLDRTPLVFGDADPHDLVSWFRMVSALDFDVYLTGEGDRRSKARVTARGDYLAAIEQTVVEGYDAGHSLARIQASPLPDAYRTAPDGGARASQTADLYRDIRLVTAEVTGTIVARLTEFDSAFCRDFATCNAGGVAPFDGGGTWPFGSFGFGLSNGRVGAVFEATMGEQWRTSRTSRQRDDDLVRRELRTSALVRYSTRPKRLSLALLGGISVSFVDIRGRTTLKDSRLFYQTRLPIEQKMRTGAVTTGIDVRTRLSRGMSLVVPIRLNYGIRDYNDEEPVALSRTDLQAGVGIAIRVYRSIR